MNGRKARKMKAPSHLSDPIADPVRWCMVFFEGRLVRRCVLVLPTVCMRFVLQVPAKSDSQRRRLLRCRVGIVTAP